MHKSLGEAVVINNLFKLKSDDYAEYCIGSCAMAWNTFCLLIYL